MITLGSICTGYGGIELGLALAGLKFDVAFHAEDGDGPSKVLKVEHGGSVPNVGDVKSADWASIGRVDVLTSGDPCQSISIAGRQAGRADPRFLWPWVREAYRALDPNVIFFENVMNMTSHDGGRTMRERFQHLREDGYGVRYTVLGACAVGAPHHRHRWFALASRDFTGVERVGGGKAICGAPRGGGRILLPSPTAADGSGGPGTSPARTGGMNLRTAVTLLPTPKATDGSNGGPNQRDGAGNYYLPGIANLLPTPRATDIGTAGRRSSDGWRPQLGQAVIETWGKFAEAVALWEQVIELPAPAPTVPGVRGGVRLNPELPEWMMGLRPGMLTDALDRNAALKAAGNGVVPLQAAAAWRLLNGCAVSI